MKRIHTAALTAILVGIITGPGFTQATKSQKSTQPSVQYADSILKAANAKSEADFTVPSFTRLKKAIVLAGAGTEAAKMSNLADALKNLESKETPYSIVANISADPTTKMAFNWFTNPGVTGTKVQVIRGVGNNSNQFLKPVKTVYSTGFAVDQLNYCILENGLLTLAGIPDNSKKNYRANKALVTGLKPNTTYSYRVGKEGNWSETGTFKTGARRKNEFSFIYTTDPQANTDDMFNISQKTTHAALRTNPDANFWLNCGDLVQTPGSENSEWEWEQFFLTQQDIFLHIPFAPVLGNHDKSENKNFTFHFNTDSTGFDHALSTSPGSIYSFVYGNALFLAFSFEDYDKPGYLDALANWMRSQVVKHPEVKWRIAYYHKTIYTGSSSHQSDSDSKIIRDRIAPLFDSLKIDLALQGHDHIYEVIGPVKNKQIVPGTIKNQQQVPVDPRENITGRMNGEFDVKDGTVYFLNNSSGRKKYEPRTKAQMESEEANLGIKNYFGLFAGRFGQTGRPTFSNIKVTRNTITLTTFEVSDTGIPSLFDEIKLVK